MEDWKIFWKSTITISIPRIPTLISLFPTSIPRIPTNIIYFAFVLFPDSPSWLLQIVCLIRKFFWTFTLIFSKGVDRDVTSDIINIFAKNSWKWQIKHLYINFWENDNAGQFRTIQNRTFLMSQILNWKRTSKVFTFQ